MGRIVPELFIGRVEGSSRGGFDDLSESLRQELAFRLVFDDFVVLVVAERRNLAILLSSWRLARLT
jgi:hypothetical protein